MLRTSSNAQHLSERAATARAAIKHYSLFLRAAVTKGRNGLTFLLMAGLLIGCDSSSDRPDTSEQLPSSLMLVELGATSETVTSNLGAASDSASTHCFPGILKRYPLVGGEVRVVIALGGSLPEGVVSVRLDGDSAIGAPSDIKLGSSRRTILERLGEPAEHVAWDQMTLDRYVDDGLAVELHYENGFTTGIEIQVDRYRQVSESCLYLPLRVGRKWEYVAATPGVDADSLHANWLNPQFVTTVTGQRYLDGHLYYEVTDYARFQRFGGEIKFDTLLLRVEGDRLYAHNAGLDQLLFDFAGPPTHTQIKNEVQRGFTLYNEGDSLRSTTDRKCVAWYGRTHYEWDECFERGVGRSTIFMRDNGLRPLSEVLWSLTTEL